MMECIDCGAKTDGSARCKECWDSRFGEEMKFIKLWFLGCFKIFKIVITVPIWMPVCMADSKKGDLLLDKIVGD